jgi:hypothetical protein
MRPQNQSGALCAGAQDERIFMGGGPFSDAIPATSADTRNAQRRTYGPTVIELRRGDNVSI